MIILSLLKELTPIVFSYLSSDHFLQSNEDQPIESIRGRLDALVSELNNFNLIN